MRQAILGVSIFVGLQIALFLVLFGVTLWEARQLDRTAAPRLEVAPADRSEPAPTIAALPHAQDLPLSA
jgi:hypothetical protein